MSFEVSKLKNMMYRLVRVYTCQNATLLEITCHGSNIFLTFFVMVETLLTCPGPCSGTAEGVLAIIPRTLATDSGVISLWPNWVKIWRHSSGLQENWVYMN